MATIPASENEFPQLLLTEGAAAATPAAGLIVAYAKAGGVYAWKDSAGNEHIIPGDASTVSFDPSGLSAVSSTDVQGAIGELDAAIAAGGIPATIFDAQGDIIIASAADTAVRLALGASGEALISDGTTVAWGRPKGALKDHATLRYTTGDITCDADNVWEDLAGVGDLTMTAASGDIIEVGCSFSVSNTTNVSLTFDVGTIVSAAVVNHISTGAAPDNSLFGVGGWRCAASAQQVVSGSILYQLQAGDITSGTVVLRLRDHPEGTTNRDINASSTRPLHFWAVNLGPAI